MFTKLFKLNKCSFCSKILDGTQQRRWGRFPYHLRGSETALLDDWTIEGPYVLVAACDGVKTRTGGLVVLRGEGPASCSPLFHVVVPSVSEDAGYLYGFLRTVDAARLVVGPEVLRQVPLASLRALAVPWPDSPLRALVTEMFEEIWSVEEGLAMADDGAMEARDRKATWLSSASSAAIDALLSLPALIMALLGLEANRRKSCDAACPPAGTSQEEPVVDVGAEGDAHADAIRAHGRLVPDGLPDGMSFPLSQEAILPGDEVVLMLMEAFVDERDSSRTPIDVVAETQDLARGGVGRTSLQAVCVPGPTEGVWCSTTVKAFDPRWVWGTPPRNRSDYAWLQQTFACLDEGGVGTILMRNAPLHSTVGADRGLRATMVASGQVRCVIALPPRLLDGSGAPQSLVILQRGAPRSSILLVDLQDRGVEMGDACRGQGIARREVDRVIAACRAWMREEPDPLASGPWRAVSLKTVEEADQVLVPWAYMDHGAE